MECISRIHHRSTRMKRLSFAFLLILASLSLTFAKDEDAITIRIGAILPLNGPVSFMGAEQRNVLLMAQQEINSRKTGPRVELIFEDSKGGGSDAILAYDKLRRQNVKYVVTTLTAPSEAVKPLCERDRIVQVALSVHSDLSNSTKFMIRPYYGLADEMKFIASYIASQGGKRMATLYVNTPENDAAINQHLKNFLKAENIVIVGRRTYEFTDTSVQPQLEALKSLNPDFIVTIDFGLMYPTILRQASALGIRDKILGGLGIMVTPPLPRELSNGFTFAASSFFVEPTRNYTRFARAYQARYKSKVTFDGVYTYDALQILYHSLCHGGDTVSNLRNRAFHGISGKITIDTTGSGHVAMDLGRFNNKGKIVRVTQARMANLRQLKKERPKQ
jgi:branched-chain amino acid transport system substrate-binding protein